ncbi:hypothetical protein [Enterococcus sp. AZ109]|uniref:hypothetical protein n=1 Tax=Enterococcus sp. AZ109 TaxID=2774634 RepID=UPI003F259F90
MKRSNWGKAVVFFALFSLSLITTTGYAQEIKSADDMISIKFTGVYEELGKPVPSPPTGDVNDENLVAKLPSTGTGTAAKRTGVLPQTNDLIGNRFTQLGILLLIFAIYGRYRYRQSKKFQDQLET